MSEHNPAGRKSRDALNQETRRLLNEAGLKGARYIRDLLYKKLKPSPTKLKAAELAIAHAIGTPRQTNIELHGEILSMSDITRLAAEFENAANKDNTVLLKADGKTNKN
jgi:hypothetical protein